MTNEITAKEMVELSKKSRMDVVQKQKEELLIQCNHDIKMAAKDGRYGTIVNLTEKGYFKDVISDVVETLKLKGFDVSYETGFYRNYEYLNINWGQK
jgi:hypothetical protein